ncbi:hypothetical protein COZ63_02395 [Candidatus Berkelbacteria bacterium CG_4_8_14_3_um_filter_42_13]|uniref:Methyltransferase n=1 Tax=Candidatus Berkelbacteria bacterium CG_4_8_14_3_um_filter_42_13 TaxID=1974505 RepID=A0A2M7K0Z7_9BACT|nr:MAG: hypothetical protein COZ63_02395 [Candidatus Berkelbacteria bacterium CG_4_8_14_3_um_filter_42_13]
MRYSKTNDYIFNLDDIREEYAEATKERFKHHIGNIREGKDFGTQTLNPLGKQPDDWWQIQPIAPSAKERLGYPTQKPEALLERIIKASSNEGDWVLDPFCGCGTTVAVAEKLKRKWIGIDITTLAITLIKSRLEKKFPERNLKIKIDGLPKDLAGARKLAEKNRFEFEYWALGFVNAIPAQNKTKENMRGADKGIDGIINFYMELNNGEEKVGTAIAQVKSGGVKRNDIATLKGDLEREKAAAGIFITLDQPTKSMVAEAIAAGHFEAKFGPVPKEYPKIQILTIEDLLAHKLPDLPAGWTNSIHRIAEAEKEDHRQPLWSAEE